MSFDYNRMPMASPPPQVNFHNQPCNNIMMPPRFMPPPNFQMGVNQTPPPHHVPNTHMQLSQFPPNQSAFFPGNSGMFVDPPFLSFPNIPLQQHANIPFSNHQPCSQNMRSEMPRPVMQTYPVSEKKLQTVKTVIKSTDETLVDQFLLKIGKSLNSMPTTQQHQSSKLLKICEAKKLHCRAKVLIQKLEDAVKSNSTEIQHIKDELNSILHVLDDKDVLQDLQRKISARKKKRLRLKKIKEKAYTEKSIKEQRIDESNKNIAEWQKQEMERSESKLREEELQKQLDSALLDMRRELSTITKAIDMINSLASLRKARCNSLKNTGKDLPSTSVTESFNGKVKDAKSLLLNHKQSCSKKIDSLKMFLVAEHEQAKNEIEKKKAKEKLQLKQKLEMERNVSLFGKQKELDPFDPLWPVQKLHKQSELNLLSLLQNRRLWDQYLHPEGTSIPVEWVEPVPPSSADWENYLDEKN